MLQIALTCNIPLLVVLDSSESDPPDSDPPDPALDTGGGRRR